MAIFGVFSRWCHFCSIIFKWGIFMGWPGFSVWRESILADCWLCLKVALTAVEQTSASHFRCRHSYVEGKGYALPKT